MVKFWFRFLVGVLFCGFIIVPLYFVLVKLEQLYIKILICVIFGLLAAVLYSVLTFLHLNQFNKPLKHINYELKGLSSGGYKSRVGYNSNNESVRQLINNINSLAVEFENLEEMRRSFVASASHELRSPLASIQGFLQALLDGVIEEEADKRKYLQIAYNESKRLTGLINNMLDLSRMEAGRYPVYKTKWDINALIKEVIEKFQPMFIKSEITPETKLTSDALMVFADRSKIEQVLINLIDNAIKYSPAFSKISVNTYVQRKKLYVIVKDQGFGISKKDQMYIWDKFYMVDKARTPSKSKGTGLGLSIVKKIIEDHREIVWVESDKGNGASFFFTLPLFDPTKHSVFGKTVKNNPYTIKTVARAVNNNPQNTENYRWGV